MACQVEVMTDNDPMPSSIIERGGGKSHLGSACDIEIDSIKQTFAEKLLNGNEESYDNGSENVEEAGSSCGTADRNDVIENGHNKLDFDSEVDVEFQLTPKKSNTPKKGQKEKVTVKHANRRTSSKKALIAEKESDTWEIIELESKDNNEIELSTADVENDAEFQITPQKSNKAKKGKEKKSKCAASERLPTGEDKPADLSIDNLEMNGNDSFDEEINIDVGIDDAVELIEEDSALETTECTNSSDQKVKECETGVFSRLRNTMQFSVSPKKQSEKKEEVHGLRAVTGRRPLHNTSSLSNYEQTVSRKRKTEFDNEDSPQKKCFITTFSEQSPGWKFFTSPFNRFWSPKKSATETTCFTPVRKLHEDVESMIVNVSDTVEKSLQVNDLEVSVDEKKQEIDDKPIFTDPQSKWKCVVM